jgi:GNAT superfamily N-acetyltransferase
VVEAQREVVGYMTATLEYSTWEAQVYVHMDCLYLREPFRGRGLGRGMIQVLRAFAAERNCRLIQWQTPVENADGIAFYERIGARSKAKRRYFLHLEQQ